MSFPCNYEVSATRIRVFDAEAILTCDQGWTHNFDGFSFRPLPPQGAAYHGENCIVNAVRMGLGDLTQMLVVSPQVAVVLFAEAVLTEDDFKRISLDRPCYFDIPDVRFGSYTLPIRVPVVPLNGWGMATATRLGWAF